MRPEERARAFKEGAIYRLGVEKKYPLLINEGKELTRAGVRFIDLTTVFAEIDEPAYSDDCCHLTLAGNEMVAIKIGQTILEDYQPRQ